MGLITDGIFLLITFYTFNHIYVLLQRNNSKIPAVQLSWIDFVTWKHLQSILEHGYHTYSKASKAFLYQTNYYVLPPSLFTECRKLPGTVMDSHAANEDFLLLGRSIGHDYHDVLPFMRANVMRSIPGLVPVICEKVASKFEHYYSSPDGSWRSVPLWQTTFDMMSCIAARFMFGATLSEDPVFIDRIAKFVRAVSIEGLLLAQFPKFLKPAVMFFLPSRKRFRLLRGLLKDAILESLEETHDGRVMLRVREAKPDDPLLPQMVEFVFRKLHDPSDPSALTRDRVVDSVTGRILGILFAAVDTTTATSSQVFLDLASHPSAQYADVIKAEISNAVAAQNGELNATALSELKYLDSFIKESQRLHPIGALLAARLVRPPQGWTFSNGDHLPHGAILNLPARSVHLDEVWYDRPTEFDGFRFVNDKHPESIPSDTFLSFGHGNHSCPGRRLALVVIKCIVVELLTKYEYEEMAERPPDFLIGIGIMPNMKQHVRVRRAPT